LKNGILKIVFAVSYLALSILSILLGLYAEGDLRSGIRVLPLLVLIIMYAFEAKKTEGLAISFLVFTVMADIIITHLKLLNTGFVMYGFSFLILAQHAKQSLFKKKQKQMLRFFLLSLLLFLIIFIFAIQEKGSSFIPILFYGLTISLAFSFYITSYLNNMGLDNYLLFIAISIRILSDAIVVMVMFNGASVYFSILSLLFYLISNFLFCRGFIVKTHSVKVKNRRL